jgi:beta-N-acetylhexosaminidase
MWLWLTLVILLSTSVTDDETQGTGNAVSNPKEEKSLFLPAGLRFQVDSIYNSMTNQQRAAQMIMVASGTNGSKYSVVKQLLVTDIAASVLFLKGKKSEFSRQSSDIRSFADQVKPYSILFACDCEPTLMHKKWNDVDPVLPSSRLTGNKKILSAVYSINHQMQDAGVGLNFAPVVDKAGNKIIKNRAFSKHSREIVERASAFITATQSAGIAATVKHFPGHGAIKGDSHKSTVYINGPLTEIETFRETIQNAKPMVVMVGHIVVMNNKDYDTKGLPSSVSSRIIKGLLKDEIGFDGVVVTDAMNMKAVTSIPDADWKAVEAGADLVLMPADPYRLNQRISSSLSKGDVYSKQLETSIKKVIRLKLMTSAANDRTYVNK